MIKNIKVYFVIALIASLAFNLFLSCSSSFALDTTFSQKILPINCIFTIVNAGTGELYYVTPQACGVYVPTISQSSGTSQSTATNSSSDYAATPNIAHQSQTSSGTLYTQSGTYQVSYAPLVKSTYRSFSSIKSSHFISTNLVLLLALILFAVIILAVVLIN